MKSGIWKCGYVLDLHGKVLVSRGLQKHPEAAMSDKGQFQLASEGPAAGQN